jgi:hypothetical protein
MLPRFYVLWCFYILFICSLVVQTLLAVSSADISVECTMAAGTHVQSPTAIAKPRREIDAVLPRAPCLPAMIECGFTVWTHGADGIEARA